MNPSTQTIIVSIVSIFLGMANSPSNHMPNEKLPNAKTFAIFPSGSPLSVPIPLETLSHLMCREFAVPAVTARTKLPFGQRETSNHANAKSNKLALASNLAGPAIKPKGNRNLNRRTKVNPNSSYQRPKYDQLNSFLVLVLEPHARKTKLISDFRSFMGPDEIDKAQNLIDSYQTRFADLRRRRSEIMEYERNEKMPELLLENQKNVRLLVSEVKARIVREIFTPEQLKRFRESRN